MRLELRTFAGVILLGALPAAVSPRDASYREISIERLDEDTLATGTPVRVTGKYKELIDGDLVLFGTRVRFRLNTPELKKRVLDFSAQRDNLTVLGRTADAGNVRAVDVDEISLADSDVKVLTAETDRLGSAGKEAEKGSVGLLQRVLSAYAIHADPVLLPLVRRLFTLSLGAGAKPVDARTSAMRLDLVRGVHEAVCDMKLSVELAAELEARTADKAPVVEFLRGINSKRYGGRWLSQAEFKQLEGFVDHGGHWISPREKDLLEAMERFRKERQSTPILRRRTDREYQILSEKGIVEEGMKSEEVCVGLGFPDRVERRLFDSKEFDQWIYGSKYYYFFAGTLVEKPPSDKAR